MKAIRIHAFGGPEVLRLETLERPTPADQEVLVGVHAAGVGPWDAWVRSGKSALPQPLPLTPGSDIAGTVISIGTKVKHLGIGDEVYGVTNAQFIGGYAEYAAAIADMLAPKPETLDYIQAASIPVVASTAWQALFDKAGVTAGQTVIITGAAGNVGGYAVQLASQAGAVVVAIAATVDHASLLDRGADEVFSDEALASGDLKGRADAVIDTVGGQLMELSFGVIKPGGILISIVGQPNEKIARQYNVRSEFFLVEVNADRLMQLTKMFDDGQLKVNIGEVLPLERARVAHEMLAGALHAKGKIVLVTES